MWGTTSFSKSHIADPPERRKILSPRKTRNTRKKDKRQNQSMHKYPEHCLTPSSRSFLLFVFCFLSSFRAFRVFRGEFFMILSRRTAFDVRGQSLRHFDFGAVVDRPRRLVRHRFDQSRR